VTVNVPANGAADGDAAQRLEGARTGSHRSDVLADLGASLPRLEFFLDGRADARDAGVQVSATQSRPEDVQDVEGGPVVVARVNVQAARQVVADRVLARAAAAECQLAGRYDAEPVGVAAGAHDPTQ